MTTILFDPVERALYADSQITSNNTITSTTMKKIKHVNVKGLGYCLVAWSGTVDGMHSAIDLLTGESKDKIKDDDYTNVIIVDKNGVIYESGSDDMKIIRNEEQSLVTFNGSGWMYAYSAYEATKNPIKSMSVAKSLDIYSGGKTMKASFVNGVAVYEYFD